MAIFACFPRAVGTSTSSNQKCTHSKRATIRPRKRDDSTAYCTQMRTNRDGQRVYQETQTFERKQVDQAWMERPEAELAVLGAIERMNRKTVNEKGMIDR
ncbi:chorismate mutase [Pseudomonas syringae]|nr:hypothetical protein [Pseudomonas syringae]MCI3944938.1 chorismate mutase [Pseudomonas syringae]